MNASKTEDFHYQPINCVFDSLTKFVGIWKDGSSANFNMNCKDGRAWMNFSVCLGRLDTLSRQSKDEFQFSPGQQTGSGTRLTPSKQRRNRERAKAFKLKKNSEYRSSDNMQGHPVHSDNQSVTELNTNLNKSGVDCRKMKTDSAELNLEPIISC